ncbi:MAG: fluoride efflux transporter CrcB [Acidobacteriota bacterium]
MGRNIILVGVGSLIGGTCRYLAALFITETFRSAFPYGTFAVNIVGCLAIGVIYGLAERFDWFSPDLRLFLATGFCGGFTTFSSFAYENIQLLQDKDYLTFGAYSGLSFVLGLLAAFIGLSLAKV